VATAPARAAHGAAIIARVASVELISRFDCHRAPRTKATRRVLRRRAPTWCNFRAHPTKADVAGAPRPDRVAAQHQQLHPLRASALDNGHGGTRAPDGLCPRAGTCLFRCAAPGRAQLSPTLRARAPRVARQPRAGEGPERAPLGRWRRRAHVRARLEARPAPRSCSRSTGGSPSSPSPYARR